MAERLLTKKQISKFLKDNPNWSVSKNNRDLSCSENINEYLDGLILIARVAVHAQILNHHPDVHFKYGEVKFKLTTHEAKGLTQKDIKLAGEINKLLKK